jgi:hypothetical protein
VTLLSAPQKVLAVVNHRNPRQVQGTRLYVWRAGCWGGTKDQLTDEHPTSIRVWLANAPQLNSKQHARIMQT